MTLKDLARAFNHWPVDHLALEPLGAGTRSTCIEDFLGPLQLLCCGRKTLQRGFDL